MSQEIVLFSGQIINALLIIGIIYVIVKFVKNSTQTTKSLQGIEKELQEIKSKIK